MYVLRDELEKLEVGETFTVKRRDQQTSLTLLRKQVSEIEKRAFAYYKILTVNHDWCITRVATEKDKLMARKPKALIEPVARIKTTVGKMLTPEQIAQGGSEHAHQCALMQWISTVWRHPLGRLVFAVPNGGERRAHVGASMAAEGVKRGVPDLCWPVTIGNGKGLWIELKTPSRERAKNGGCTDDQVKWHQDLLEQGYAVAIAYGWQAAAWVLYLYSLGQLTLPVDGPLLALSCENPPETGNLE